MRISVKNGGSWTQTDALWMALSIDRHLRTQKDHPVILHLQEAEEKLHISAVLPGKGENEG